MDEQTAMVLALQLVALFSIAGALLLYLLCKIRSNISPEADFGSTGGGKAILVTSCDNAIGLQVAIHLANRGFRVFAGLKEGASSGQSSDSAPSRVIRAWQKHRESLPVPLLGALVALPLDVTREDLSREAVDIIRAHLPAGENGLWAVINTGGLSCRGKVDQQDVVYWDAMLKTNVIGVLRTARVFQGLLRAAKGRMINLGASDEEAGLVVYSATRYAVEGASRGLRQELAPLNVKVVTINPKGISPDLMFAVPKLVSKSNSDISLNMNGVLEYQPTVLSSSALQVLDIAVTSGTPQTNYTLTQKGHWYSPLQLWRII